MLGNDICFGHDRHEGMIPIPTGHEVDMEMFANARSGRLANVYPDIYPVWLEGLL